LTPKLSQGPYLKISIDQKIILKILAQDLQDSIPGA
jgi:hypothetical protein